MKTSKNQEEITKIKNLSEPIFREYSKTLQRFGTEIENFKKEKEIHKLTK